MGTESRLRQDGMEVVAGHIRGKQAEILTPKVLPQQQELPLRVGGGSLSLRGHQLQRTKECSQKEGQVMGKRAASTAFHFTD